MRCWRAPTFGCTAKVPLLALDRLNRHIRRKKGLGAPVDGLAMFSDRAVGSAIALLLDEKGAFADSRVSCRVDTSVLCSHILSIPCLINRPWKEASDEPC